MKKFYKDLIFTVIFGLVLLISALTISFTISQFMPGDPALAYLPEGTIDWDEYEAIREALGLNAPIIIQFCIYAVRILAGDWGRSFSISRGTPAQLVMMQPLARSLDLLILPLVISIILGFLVGKYSIKRSPNKRSRIIRLLFLIGFAFPIFLVGMLLQFVFGYVFPIFPPEGYKTLVYGDPSVISGFRFIDALFSGELYLISDYLNHLILPWITMTISLIVFWTLLVRSYYINRVNRPHYIKNSFYTSFIFHIAVAFGTVFAFLMVTETLFDFGGIHNLLIIAFMVSDYWVILGILFSYLISFVLVITLSLLSLIVYKKIKNKDRSTPSVKKPIDEEVKPA